MLKENVKEQHFTIALSKDSLEAYLQINKPGIELTEPEISQIIEEIENKGITDLRYSPAELSVIIKASPGFDKIIIATGQAPIDQKNGYIEIAIKNNNDGKPLVLDDGRVDFYNLGLVTSVYENDTLAVVHHPEGGFDGIDVKGNVVPFKPGKKAKIPRGKNIKFDENTGKIVALINGQVSFSEDNISVYQVLEVKDVDFKTGNIDFVGSVIINGSVTDGFTVKAQGDVTVMGYVDSSFITCSGNLNVSGGIQGRNKGKVDAVGNVVARYIENCEVRAGGSVIVKDAIMHSKVYAKDKILAVEGKGLMVGGIVSAGKEIHCNTLGSHLATVTEMEVGVNPELRQQLQVISKDLSKMLEDNKKAKQAERILNIKQEQLKKVGKELPMEHKGMLVRLGITTKHLDKKINETQSQQEELMEKLLSSSGGIIKGNNTVYPGVKITIGTRYRNISDKRFSSTFSIADDGEIKIT